MVQTLIIIQADANRIKTGTPKPVNITVPPRSQAPSLVKSMVSTSARGPSISFQTIKPELGAPGASVSAVAGTGTQEAAFGGTSGATPMIAGSAALILEAFPRAIPAEVKARLMNNAQTGNTPDTGIRTAPNLLPNQVAPATRIGAGEVRVDRAVAARTLAFSSEDESATFAFGYAAVASRQEIRKKVQVVNLANSHFRRKRVERMYLSRSAAESPVFGHEPDTGRRDELWNGLQRLPVRQRTAIVLRIYEDLPEQRVAEILGCRPGTVRSLVSRGLAEMRVHVRSDGNG